MALEFSRHTFEQSNQENAPSGDERLALERRRDSTLPTTRTVALR
jgi:hypothetical protein